MAQIHEEVFIIRFSSLMRENQTAGPTLLNQEIISSLEQVAQELAGNAVIVEVQTQP